VHSWSATPCRRSLSWPPIRCHQWLCNAYVMTADRTTCWLQQLHADRCTQHKHTCLRPTLLCVLDCRRACCACSGKSIQLWADVASEAFRSLLLQPQPTWHNRQNWPALHNLTTLVNAVVPHVSVTQTVSGTPYDTLGRQHDCRWNMHDCRWNMHEPWQGC
jgi:hypothetical protein